MPARLLLLDLMDWCFVKHQGQQLPFTGTLRFETADGTTILTEWQQAFPLFLILRNWNDQIKRKVASIKRSQSSLADLMR
jgi:hypothetical protein